MLVTAATRASRGQCNKNFTIHFALDRWSSLSLLLLLANLVCADSPLSAGDLDICSGIISHIRSTSSSMIALILMSLGFSWQDLVGKLCESSDSIAFYDVIQMGWKSSNEAEVYIKQSQFYAPIIFNYSLIIRFRISCPQNFALVFKRFS